MTKHQKREETTEQVVEETTEEQVDPTQAQEEPQVGRRPGEAYGDREGAQAEEPGDSDSGAADDDSATAP